MADFIVRREFCGTAAELHAIPMPTAAESPELWVMRPSAPALVIGSSQKVEQFDQRRLTEDGVQLGSRRSGGGAVFIEPMSTLWIDLVAPRTTELWSTELAENFLIVGRIWQRAFSSLGIETDVCTDSPGRTPASTLACWAGLGWGELTLSRGAHHRAKVVGLSQRRTRWGARVQAMAVFDSSAGRVSDYLDPPDAAIVRPAIATVEVDLTTEQLESAVLAAFDAHHTPPS